MKILGVFAHPDDETVLIGGTLAMLSAKGAELHILSATRGEGGELGEPALARRETLGAVREQELRCAVNELGGSSVNFLGYEDPTIETGQEGKAFDADPRTLSRQIQKHLLDLKPDAVLTHGSNGEYGHPAHILVHQAVYQAVRLQNISMYGISAFYTEHPRPRLANKDNPAHIVLDISPWFGQKVQAAHCHRTQHALFVRRSSAEAGKALAIAEVLMHIESLHRFLPASGDLSEDIFTRFIETRCKEARIDFEVKPD